VSCWSAGRIFRRQTSTGSSDAEAGAIDSAEIYFRKELESNQKNARAFSNLATVFYLREELDSAMVLSTRAIEAGPFLADGYLVQTRVNRREKGPGSTGEIDIGRRRESQRKGQIFV